jgi:LPXTG-motif cell wall-anchored protein
MSEGLTVAANAVIDLNGKVLSFVNETAAMGMAITGMGATMKNGTVSATGIVKTINNSTMEVGFGSVASGVTLNNVNVRFYAPAEWTMFGQNVNLVYGTYNRDITARFANSEKLEVVEQNGIYTVRDKVEAPEAAPAAAENADAAVPVTETAAAETTEATGTEAAESEQTATVTEENTAETEEGSETAAEAKTEEGEQTEAEAQQAEVAVEGEEANAESENAAVEGEEAKTEGEDVEAEGEEANAEGEVANAEGEQSAEDALPESNEQQAEENPADDEPADETPVNIVEEKEEEPVTEEEIRADLDAENAEDADAVTLTGTDPVTGAVVIITGKNLPEGLTVVVKPLSLDTIDGLAEDERAVLALDISLVDAEGNEYEPENDPNVGAVSVQIKHPSLGNLEEDESLALYHVVDDVSRMVGSAEQTEEGVLGFATGSFSPFIITVSTGNGTANTGSLGETHHRKVTITNVTGDIYVKGALDDGQNLVFKVEGGVVPESISVIDPDQVSSGNASIYKSGYMIYDSGDFAALDTGTDRWDYVVTDVSGNKIDLTKPETVVPDPYYIRFSKASLANAPTGKWAFVFWFRDTTDSGAQRVYMVQYVTIVPKAVIKALAPVDGFGDFYYNKCSYDPLEIFITADLHKFSIKDSKDKTVVWYDYTKDPKHVYVNTKDYPNKTYNYGDVFQITDYKVSGDLLGISDYWTEDPVSHEFIGGKTLKVYHELLKKLDFGDYTIHVEQANHHKNNMESYESPYTNYAEKDLKLSLLPGIAVADGLNDYIKGKNVWIKFVSCWPIDYDDDGTLAIWIGGQKITKDYYSISNDHQTLWIYRNLLDQLRSNNSYTLTARLWRLNKTDGEREYFYPAQATFNILAAGSTSYKSPKTGDNSNVALWAAVAVLSGGAVVALIPKKKKVKVSK